MSKLGELRAGSARMGGGTRFSNSPGPTCLCYFVLKSWRLLYVYRFELQSPRRIDQICVECCRACGASKLGAQSMPYRGTFRASLLDVTYRD